MPNYSSSGASASPAGPDRHHVFVYAERRLLSGGHDEPITRRIQRNTCWCDLAPVDEFAFRRAQLRPTWRSASDSVDVLCPLSPGAALMPDSLVTYTVDQARGLVEVIVREGFTYPDIVATFAALRSDPRIRPEFDRLALYEATHVPLTSANVRAMVEAAVRVPHAQSSRVAVVVRCDVVFGMMRMYEMYGDGLGIQVRVFRDRVEAARWLAERPR